MRSAIYFTQQFAKSILTKKVLILANYQGKTPGGKGPFVKVLVAFYTIQDIESA